MVGTDIVLAKSPKSAPSLNEATLLSHTEKVVQSFQLLFGFQTPTRLGRQWLRFFKLDPVDFAEFRTNGILACGLHDIGKANTGFQMMVRGKGGFQVVRHEHLSGLILWLPAIRDWLKQFPGCEFKVLFSAVAGHHLRSASKDFAVPDPDRKTLSLFPKAIKEIVDYTSQLFASAVQPPQSDVPELWCFDGPSSFEPGPQILRDQVRKALSRYPSELKKNLRQNRLLASVRAALILADSCGSAIIREGKDLYAWIEEAFGQVLDSSFIENEIILPRKHQIEKTKRRPFEWSDFQDAAETLPSRALLLAPCGSGKTLAAWRWIKGQLADRPAARVIFLYPTRATATEGFKDYVSWAPEADAALMHGTAAYDLEGLFDQPDDERFEKDYATEDRLYALGFWNRRVFSATIDQFLGFMQNIYRSVCLMPLLADSVVVVDEVHSFDKSLFSALMLFLKWFDIPVLCMTASLPKRRFDDLVEDCGLVPFPMDIRCFPNLEVSATLPRYEVRVIENQEDAESLAWNAFQSGQRVLWVVNTVARCQQIAKRLNTLCYHSRFKLEDRKRHHKTVTSAFSEDGSAVLAITTQVCEMSLDLDADVLISEKAPITSMIQRMGRCNRHAIDQNRKPGRVCFYTPEDHKPYTGNEMAGSDDFIAAINGKAISRIVLQSCLEKYGKDAVSVASYSAFLEDGPWAASRELRDESAFTVSALLDDDIPTYFERRRDKQPIDGLLVPVPRRFGRLHPKVGRFPLVAPSSHYSPEYGFFESPLEVII